MNTKRACPSPGTLKAMHEGRLADDELPELGEHLEQCEGCRQRFDQLAEPAELTPSGASRIAAVMQAPVLRHAVEKLERSPWTGPENSSAEPKRPKQVANNNRASEQTAALPDADLPSGFFDPVDDPHLLGKLGMYEILELIGSGGMGVVLKGRDPRLNRVVAIKVLAPHLAASGAARQRFFREAQAAAAVAHEHVVTIHAVEEVKGLPILVMQYVPGVSLREKIERDGPLDLRRILRISLQAASGLAAAHAQGLIHRDIKPANILLENGVERVRITDFGLATAADDVALTQTGCLAGTPQYMSPEQAQGRPIDARSDLFSLGSVMYEMCTARAAFRASNPYAAIQRVCHEEPRPIREISPDLPPWLSEIVERLLHKDAGARFQSANELVEELRSRLTGVQQPGGEPATSAAAQTALPAAPSSPPRRPRLTPPITDPAVALVAPARLLVLAAVLMCLASPAPFLLAGVPDIEGLFGFVASAAILAMGIALLVPSLLMLQRSSYGCALAAAILAMLPLTPHVIVTFPLGLWALFVLLRDDVRATFVDEQPVSHTASPFGDEVRLRAPARGLLITAVLQLILAMAPHVLFIFAAAMGVDGIAMWAVVLFAFAVLFPVTSAVVQLVNAIRTIKSGSAASARLAAFCGALPLSPVWLLNLPMAIWMWTALHRQSSEAQRAPSKVPFPSEERTTAWPVLLASSAVLLLMFVVCGTGVFVLYGSRHHATVIKEHYHGHGTHPDDITRLLHEEAAKLPGESPADFPLGPPRHPRIELERDATGAIAISPDGELMAIGDRDGFVRIHHVNSGNEAFTLIESREPIVRLAFSPDGLRLAAVRDTALDIWDLNNRRLWGSIPSGNAPGENDGRRALHILDPETLLVDRGRSLVVMNLKGEKRLSLEHPSNIASATVSPDGTRVATGDELGLVKIWELNDGKLKTSIEAGSSPAAVFYLRDNLLAVASGRSLTVRNDRGEELSSVKAPDDLWSDKQSGLLAALSDGQMVVRIGSKPAVDIHNPIPNNPNPTAPSILLCRWSEAALAAHFEGDDMPLLGMAVDQKRKRLAIVSEKRVQVFPLESLLAMKPHAGNVQQANVLWSAPATQNPYVPFHRTLDVAGIGKAVTGHQDGTVAIWDLEAKQRQSLTQLAQAPVRDVAFGLVDQYVLCGDDDGNLHMLFTHSGSSTWHTNINHNFEQKYHRVVSVGFRPPHGLYAYEGKGNPSAQGIRSFSFERPTDTWWVNDQDWSRCRALETGNDGVVWKIGEHDLTRCELEYYVVSPSWRKAIVWRPEDKLTALAIHPAGLPIVGSTSRNAADDHAHPPEPPAAAVADSDEGKSSEATKGKGTKAVFNNACCLRLLTRDGNRMLRRYEAGEGEVTAIDVRSDGRLILAAVVSPPPPNEGQTAPTGPPVTTIHLWDAVTSQEVAHWEIDEMITGVGFLHTGTQFIAAGSSLRIFTIPQSIDEYVRRR